MKPYHLVLILLGISLTGCLTTYEKVEESDKAGFIKFERDVASPLLGSITRYVKVDDKQQCRQAYSEHKLLAVHNKGNPLVSGLNVDGLYVKPGNFRILINTVAGVGSWCDVFVNFDVIAGQKYKIIASGDAYVGVNKCSAKLYQLTTSGEYQQAAFNKYYECNK